MVSQEELSRAVVVTGIRAAPQVRRWSLVATRVVCVCGLFDTCTLWIVHQDMTDTAIYDAFAPFGLIERVIVQRYGASAWLCSLLVVSLLVTPTVGLWCGVCLLVCSLLPQTATRLGTNTQSSSLTQMKPPSAPRRLMDGYAPPHGHVLSLLPAAVLCCSAHFPGAVLHSFCLGAVCVSWMLVPCQPRRHPTLRNPLDQLRRGET